MQKSLHRPLLQALFLSLLIHAVLLLGVVGLVPLRVDQPAGPLSAEIRRQRASAETPAATASPAVPIPSMASARSPSAPPERRPIIASAAPSEAALSPVEPALPAPAAGTAPTHAAPATATATAAPAPARAASAANRTAGEAASAGAGNISADDLRQYRMSLAVNAARFKRYPPLARERGWEGTVDLALEFGPLLPAPQVSLANSSGRRVIDEQAVETMREAARVTSLPEGLKGRDFRVRFAVVFSLEDER